MIKYLGSKRLLLPAILDTVGRCGSPKSVIDLFSGTSRVGHALKGAGYRVIANDHNRYAATLAQCYVQADAEDVVGDAEKLVNEFNSLPGNPGYFTDTFCVQSRFFQPKNGERVDAIRNAIAEKGLPPDLEAVMLVSLMEAADRVDSTTGVQMAYLKAWAKRAENDIKLRVPNVLPKAVNGRGEAHCLDAFDAAKGLEADIAYLDPPYNQHKYLGNYHIWESLVRWDEPEFYGVACKRVDCRERKSIFNSKPRFRAAMEDLISSVRAETLIISFSNEGYLAREDFESILGKLWDGNGFITTIEHDFKRYVGAQIGIHNPQGKRVGKVSHLRNKEYFYVASKRDFTSALEPISQLAPEQQSLFS